MLERCQLILVAWHEQTSAEQHIHRLRRMDNRMTGSGAWRPKQSQTRARDGLFGERFKLLNAWQQIGLLLLNEHRPWHALLQAPEPSMPLTTGEEDAGTTALREVPQGCKRGFAKRRTVDQNGLRTNIKPPGRASATVSVGWKNPEIRPDLQRRTAWLQRGGHHRHDASPELSLL